MDLGQRSGRAELMDEPGLDADAYRRCLSDLAAVNRLTLAHRPVLQWLSKATADWPRQRPLRILDVGFGQGDLLRAIECWASADGRQVALEGIDLNPRSVQAARSATPHGGRIIYRAGDVFAFVPAPLPDFVVSSQFTHHLNDSQIVRFLRWSETHARRGWFIADLQRHAFAYHGFRWLARLAGWHPVVRHDGAVSIARGFHRADWQALLHSAGLQAAIDAHFPFRLCVGRCK